MDQPTDNATGDMEAPRSTVSVVIPVYNEEGSLAQVVSRVLKALDNPQIVIIDDCSTDGTPDAIGQLIQEFPASLTCVRHHANRGKTAALRTGLPLTTGQVVVVQDADFEYDPSELRALIIPITAGDADAVYGSRFMCKERGRKFLPFQFLVNKCLTYLSNVLSGLRTTDVETGHKAFRGSLIRSMIITSERFGFEIEVTAKVAKRGCTLRDVPVRYMPRSRAEGKKIRLRDAVSAVWYLLKYNLFTSSEASFAIALLHKSQHSKWLDDRAAPDLTNSGLL